MSALGDYIDGRRQIVHEWHAADVSAEDIATRLTIDAEMVRGWLTEKDRPFPGSSRDQLERLRARCASLEAAVHALGETPTDRPPTSSDFRSLALHPDPELCGCQYWAGEREGAGHNPRCEHARST